MGHHSGPKLVQTHVAGDGVAGKSGCGVTCRYAGFRRPTI